ncbi:MAG: hypothetical protein HY756_02565 [Nitrospirae bacterium]|nr:hypothetical protein [Nitrospirota bacterium]
MKKKLKLIPKFKSEAEERKFWETHDTTDYFDDSKMVRARFPNLKLSTQSISIRLPIGMLLLEDILSQFHVAPFCDDKERLYWL